MIESRRSVRTAVKSLLIYRVWFNGLFINRIFCVIGQRKKIEMETCFAQVFLIEVSEMIFVFREANV